MSKSIILNFGSGNLQMGFSSMNIEILDKNNVTTHRSDYFNLAVHEELANTYQVWENLLGFNNNSKNEIEFEAKYTTRAKGGATNIVTATDFSQTSEKFKEQINNWLGSNKLLEQYVRTHSSLEEEVRIIINSNDRQLQKLPLHLWSLLDDYPFSEIAFSAPLAEKPGIHSKNEGQTNILTILGNDKGIDVKKDLEIIKSLPANVVALFKPSRSEISDELWEKSWDILFFSGHSKTEDGKGIIQINDTESLTIEELKNGLKKAIANGLQLAIFNSCDGLGLAWELADLHIPQLIVMREPVPDVVAQKFARYFLSNLAKDISFYRAFRNARERLKEEFQDIHPYADWLPIIFQNTTAILSSKLFLDTQKANFKSNLLKATGLKRFQTIINDKTKDFVGRQYVFDEIDKFINNRPKGYFTILGYPGMGKSAILAKYVKDKGCIAHFNVRDEGYNDTSEFLESVCSQLIERYQLPYTSLPADATQDGKFFHQLLDEVSQKGESVVIAVDALDEVEPISQKTGTNILYLPRYVPEGIYFIMTRRKGFNPSLMIEVPSKELDLTDYEERSLEDVYQYIKNQIEKSEELQQQIEARGENIEDFTNKIASKSENNFMYLRYILSDIEQGKYKDLGLEHFPQGLQGYYNFHWEHMGMTAKPLPRTKINVVYHLAESRQPIACQLVAKYVQEEPLIVLEVLKEWQQFLRKQDLEGEICYSIYHASFRDFLHRNETVKAAGVSLREINRRKADVLWKRVYGTIRKSFDK